MQSQGSSVLLYLAYTASFAIAFGAVHSFVVLGYGEMFLLGAGVIAAPAMLVFKLAEKNTALVLAAAHIFLAVAFHPEVRYKEPKYIDTQEQISFLQAINHSDRSWWVKADLSYELAQALKAGTLLRLRLNNPILYWCFPPTMVFVCWGVIIFYQYPKYVGADENST